MTATTLREGVVEVRPREIEGEKRIKVTMCIVADVSVRPRSVLVGDVANLSFV